MISFLYYIIDLYRCFNADQLVKQAIIGYNNCRYSDTKFTPFEIIKGYIKADNPHDLNNQALISNYVQNHKETIKRLSEKIAKHNKKSRKKS